MDAEALFNQARNHHQEGRISQAVTLYGELLGMVPNHPHAHYLMGVALQKLDQAEAALGHFQAMVGLRPAHVPTRLSMAQAYLQLDRSTEALECYQAVLQREPDQADALAGMAALFEKNGDHPAVVNLLSGPMERGSASLVLLGYLSRAQNRLLRHDLSAALCLDFLEHPRITEADRETALGWLEKFFPKVINPNRNLLLRLERLSTPRGRKLYLMGLIRAKREAAVEKFLPRFREIDPAGRLLGDAVIVEQLQSNKLFRLAERIGWRLVEKDPHNETHLHKLVESLLGQANADHPEKFMEAREIAGQFLAMHPDSLKANLAMGSVYMAASRPERALPYQEKVLAQNPEHPIRGSMLFTMNYDERRSPDRIFQCHREWGEWFERERKPLSVEFPNLREPSRKLRIGYLSPDLGMHPVGYFFIDVLKGHNPDLVEVFLFSNRNPADGDDELSREFRQHVGEKHWMWTRGMSGPDLVQAIRSRGIDILVEMAGHTGHNRLDVCAHRAAPVQVTWLGYPNTSGLTTIDYRFSDVMTEPPGEADTRSTETIWRLPNGFHAIRTPRDLPPVSAPPCLKNGYITFGTYNNMNKLGSESIALWADLLKRVPRSRILIKHKTLKVLNNRESLVSFFAMHGIQGWRLGLRETTAGTQAHLASYGDMDIALDPLAYNGTTTSCDALMMGVPILTLPGKTHASRVTASLLHRMGMDGWIARDRGHFLQIGSMAAQNFPLLKELREQQQARFLNSPLNDGPGMARDLEAAYREMWARYCASEVEAVVL